MESPDPVIRFDPLDPDQVRLRLRLTPGERIRVTSLDAQALAKRLIMGRLRRQSPTSRLLRH